MTVSNSSWAGPEISPAHGFQELLELLKHELPAHGEFLSIWMHDPFADSVLGLTVLPEMALSSLDHFLSQLPFLFYFIRQTKEAPRPGLEPTVLKPVRPCLFLSLELEKVPQNVSIPSKQEASDNPSSFMFPIERLAFVTICKQLCSQRLLRQTPSQRMLGDPES